MYISSVITLHTFKSTRTHIGNFRSLEGTEERIYPDGTLGFSAKYHWMDEYSILSLYCMLSHTHRVSHTALFTLIYARRISSTDAFLLIPSTW